MEITGRWRRFDGEPLRTFPENDLPNVREGINLANNAFGLH